MKKEMKMIREAYGEALRELGRVNEKVVVLDADLSHATYTSTFAEAFPDRFFNVGIAENNLVAMSVGLSLSGCIPFCSTFALFGAGRSFEIIRNSVAYPNANVKICCSHGGLTVGPDGGSHQAIEDFALMRVIPGMTVIVPSDANEAKKAVAAIAEYSGPVYMRLGRTATEVLKEQEFKIGKANVLKEGSEIALFACGIMVPEALKTASALEKYGLSAAVINMHTLKPLDAETVKAYIEKCHCIVTMEEHSVIGGLGDAVASVLLDNQPCRFLKIGINDEFGQSGEPDELMHEYGLSAEKMTERIKAWY